MIPNDSPQPDPAGPIASEGWLGYAASFPLRFAQVREDPRLDAWIVERLPAGSRGVMVASGGCNAAFLTAMGRFRTLMLVDPVPAQLALSRLKLAWLRDYGPQERLALLGHGPMAPQDRKRVLLAEFAKHQIPADRFGPLDAVAALGLDRAGRYELLFARFRLRLGHGDSFGELLALDQPERQQAYLGAHPELLEALSGALDEVMALPNLVRLFGLEATRNWAQPFARHFFQQTVRALRELPAAGNPYLAQFLTGRFPPGAAFPWLRLEARRSYTGIQFQTGTMEETLAQSREAFDFIHLSNILDWLDQAQAEALLALAAAKLRPGGWIIIRQLNSTLPVRELGPGLAWDDEAGRALHARDRSFFYAQLHVGRRR
jgi:S-adenosylmethionine-diacylglycerol 3-amino-3-carboxypropyl transferase